MNILAEYVWIGGNNELRSKTRYLPSCVNIKDIPNWDYDGSSTNQASCKMSEVILVPKAFYRDPFRTSYDIIVLCGTYNMKGEPLENNHRDMAENIFNKHLEEEPWFGIEQEYFLIDPATDKPLGFNSNYKQGQYYCSVGALNAFGRNIVEEHLQLCLLAGLKMSGINAEVAPGQWEYQIGPCVGIDSGDQLWVARYIMERVAEKYNTIVSLEPKPLKGDWNGSGCHTNFSTKKMRNINKMDGTHGINEIYIAIDKLKNKHKEHMMVYGENNNERLSGKHETSSYDTFTSGNSDRGASIKIGTKTINDRCGYFEDRRPSANMNPYLVTSKIFDTIMQ